MKKTFIIILLVLGGISVNLAQNTFNLTVSGHVLSDSTLLPVSGQQVEVMVMSSGMAEFYELFTDDSGYYSGFFMGAPQGSVDVSTIDCMGEIHSFSSGFNPGNNVFVFDFVICANPSFGCDAFYTYEIFPGFFMPVVGFYDLSTGNHSEWFWDFGDGTTSTEQNPVHTYNDFGVFYVCLSISNPDGSCQDIFCSEVNTGSTIPPDCYNWFWYNQPSTYDFEFFADANPPSDMYFWDFGDGTTGSGQNLTHTYSPNMGDIFIVTLTSYSFDPSTGDSCFAISSQKVYTLGYPGDCNNWFWYNQTPNGGNVEFFGDAFPPAESYFWDFGDGTYGSGQSASHYYDPNLGDVFQVSLTTISIDPATGDSCSYTSMQEVWLWNYPGDCSNWFWYNQASNLGIEFFGEAFPPADSYVWEFGDGTTGVGQNVSHTYDPNLGDVFMVTLTTTSVDPAGIPCTATSFQEVYTNNIPGECYNYFWYKDIGNNTIYLFGESWPAQADLYMWSFPDGTVQYGQEVYYTYDPAFGNDILVCLDTWMFMNTLDSCYAQSCQAVYIGGWNWGSISGTILADNVPADHAFAMLYTITPNGIEFFDFQQTIPNSGLYSFQFVPDGNYYVIGLLSPASVYFNQYFPTYYGDALYWYDAAVVSPYDSVSSYDIHLVPVSGSGTGICSISGNISVGAQGEPGANMQVVLMDAGENPISFTTSNDLGDYAFENLEYGIYKIKVEMAGANCEIATIELSMANPHADVDFVVNGTQIILGIDDMANSIKSLNIYPNPADDFINIVVQLLKEESVSIIITDILGKEMSTFNFLCNMGKHTLTLPVSDFPKGFYTITLRDEQGAKISLKFIR